MHKTLIVFLVALAVGTLLVPSQMASSAGRQQTRGEAAYQPLDPAAAKENGTLSEVPFGEGGRTGTSACGNTGIYKFGHSVAGGADVNGDGVADFLVGEPAYVWPSCKLGRVYIFSGADGSLINVLNSPDEYGSFGSSVDFLGDQNGDGKVELLIGTPGYDNNRGTVLPSALPRSQFPLGAL